MQRNYVVIFSLFNTVFLLCFFFSLHGNKYFPQQLVAVAKRSYMTYAIAKGNYFMEAVARGKYIMYETTSSIAKGK